LQAAVTITLPRSATGLEQNVNFVSNPGRYALNSTYQATSYLADGLKITIKLETPPNVTPGFLFISIEQSPPFGPPLSLTCGCFLPPVEERPVGQGPWADLLNLANEFVGRAWIRLQ
jgi:hypothetical protein